MTDYEKGLEKLGFIYDDRLDLRRHPAFAWRVLEAWVTYVVNGSLRLEFAWLVNQWIQRKPLANGLYAAVEKLGRERNEILPRGD